MKIDGLEKVNESYKMAAEFIVDTKNYDESYTGTIEESDDYLSAILVISNENEVVDRLEKGIDVVLVIDITGALNIKKLFPNAIFIFIMPPDLKTLMKSGNKALKTSERPWMILV